MGADPSTVQALQQGCERFIKVNSRLLVAHTYKQGSSLKSVSNMRFWEIEILKWVPPMYWVRSSNNVLASSVVMPSTWWDFVHRFPCLVSATFSVVNSVGAVALGWSFTLAAVPQILTVTFAVPTYPLSAQQQAWHFGYSLARSFVVVPPALQPQLPLELFERGQCHSAVT